METIEKEIIEKEILESYKRAGGIYKIAAELVEEDLKMEDE